MNIYKVEPKLQCENIVVNFGAKINSKLWDDFLCNNDSSVESILNVNGSSQISNFNELVDCSDFLSCVVPFPIFSSRAVDVLGNVDGLSFLEVAVDGFYKFSIGLIGERANFIDEEKSTYETLANGELMISDFAYRDPLSRFFIARDEKYYSHFVVSDDFVSLCERNNLKIRFEKVDYGHPMSFFD